MLKRKITSEIEDRHQKDTTGLLIDGARQIGKTTVIEEYLTSHHLNYIEFNLISNKLALEAFNTASDEKQLLLRLSSLSGNALVEGETFFHR